MNEAEIQQLIFDYTGQHMTVYQLADRYNLHRTTISAVLRKNGVVVTGQRMTGKQVEEAMRLYESGLTLRAIGEKFGVGESTVSRTLRRIGCKIRQPYRYASEEWRAIKIPS
jgi:IS30 family transposase